MEQAVVLDVNGSIFLLLRGAMLGLCPLQKGFLRLPYQKQTKMDEFGTFAFCCLFLPSSLDLIYMLFRFLSLLPCAMTED